MSERDCAGFRKLLSPFIDGEVSEAEARRVEDHLQACGDCRQGLEELRAVSKAMRVLEDKPLPAGFAQRLARRRAAVPAGAGIQPARALAFATAAAFVGLSLRAWLSQGPNPAALPSVLADAGKPDPVPVPIGGKWKPAPGQPFGERPAAAPSMTNEQLHASLEEEKQRMGIRRIVPPRKFPMGALAGLGSQPPAPVPLAATTPQLPSAAVVAAATAAANAPAAGTPAPEPASPGVILHSEAQRAALWAARGMQAAPPAVDYSRQQLVVVFAESAGFGLEIVGVQNFPDRVLVQYREPDIPEGASRETAALAYQFRVLPLSDRPVIFQKLR